MIIYFLVIISSFLIKTKINYFNKLFLSITALFVEYIYRFNVNKKILQFKNKLFYNVFITDIFNLYFATIAYKR